MAFIVGPIVVLAGLFLGGCGRSSSASRRAAHPDPVPDGSSYAPPSRTVNGLIAPLSSRTSPIALMLAAPRPPFAAGPAPDAAALARYPGTNDEERAENWAMSQAVGHYVTELGRLLPGLQTRDAVIMVLEMIHTHATTFPLRVSYTTEASTSKTVTVDRPEIIFLNRLVSEDAAELRGFMRRDFDEQQYQELKSAANTLLHELMADTKE